MGAAGDRQEMARSERLGAVAEGKEIISRSALEFSFMLGVSLEFQAKTENG